MIRKVVNKLPERIKVDEVLYSDCTSNKIYTGINGDDQVCILTKDLGSKDVYSFWFLDVDELSKGNGKILNTKTSDLKEAVLSCLDISNISPIYEFSTNKKIFLWCLNPKFIRDPIPAKTNSPDYTFKEFDGVDLE